MGTLTTLVLTASGVAVGFLGHFLLIRSNKPLWKLHRAVKKKLPIALLEDYNKTYFRTLDKKSIYQNLAVTNNHELIIAPEGSASPIQDLGVPIVRGDFYKGVGSTLELRKFKLHLHSLGFTDSDISKLFREIQEINEKDLKKIYKSREQADKGEYNPNDKKLKLPKDSIERLKYNIYLELPATIKSYISTGINRTMINEQMNLKVEKDKFLNKKKATAYIMIGMMGLLILFGLGYALAQSSDLFIGIAQAKYGGAIATADPTSVSNVLPNTPSPVRVSP